MNATGKLDAAAPTGQLSYKKPLGHWIRLAALILLGVIVLGGIVRLADAAGLPPRAGWNLIGILIGALLILGIGFLLMWLHLSSELEAERQALQAWWNLLMAEGLEPALVVRLPEGIILQANTGAASLFGHEVSALKGRRLHELRPDWTAQRLTRLLQEVANQGAAHEHQGSWRGADGALMWIDSTAKELEQADEPQAILFLHDLTEQRLLQDELRRQRDELEQANKLLAAGNAAKTRFLANMGHEIRTPMHAMLGFTELLSQEILGPLTNKQKSALADIKQAADHLMQMLNDILEISQAEVGKLHLDIKPVALEQVITAMHRVVRGLAWDKAITISISVEPEDLMVLADERRVKQVLYNLLSNAITFSAAGQAVHVRASRADEYAQISVIDQGPGIAPEDQKSIFEEFTQLEIGSHASEGSGLGLPLSRRLVELQGGKLTVESQSGQGSTFTFTLPRYEGERET